MEKIFILVEKTDLWLNTDRLNLLQAYFVDGGGFTNALLIALLWAVVGIIVFYFFIGMKSVRLSNLPVWLSTLAAAGLLTWLTTQQVVIGSDNAQTGFFQKAHDVMTERRKYAADENERTQVYEWYNDVRKEMASPACPAVLALNGTATILSILFFFIGSIGVKRLTVHASSVPF